jgi:hypothetical protein
LPGIFAREPALRKRVLLLLGLLLVVLGFGLVGVRLLRDPLGVTPGRFYCVEIGMSEKEVEEQFGGPAVSEENYGQTSHKCWLGKDRTCARIVFGPGGVVSNGYFVRNGHQEGDLIERGSVNRFFRWLGL